MREAMTNTGMKKKLTDTPPYEGMVRGKDGVFSENCRVIRKKETIMLQIADLMGSLRALPGMSECYLLRTFNNFFS